MARGNGLAPDVVGGGQQFLNAADAVGYGLLGAAGFLDGEGLQLFRALQALRSQQVVDLVCLATQTDHQRGMEVRVDRVTRQHAAQQFHRFAFGTHAAAGLVMDRHHAVHVRVLAS